MTDTHHNLTRWEWIALNSPFNIADGHAHQAMNPDQLQIIESAGDIFKEAQQSSQLEIQSSFAAEFFELAGQRSVDRMPEPLYHYSSSMSIEIVANFCRMQSIPVALIHPTLDNIPAILSRHGIPLEPIEEQQLSDLSFMATMSSRALFLVMPNNPTGTEVSIETFRQIATMCAKYNILLIVDLSFRFFSSLTLWDQYELLTQIGTEFIAIEDTGKTWPTLDMKLGIIVASPKSHQLLQDITDDFILNVSPFIFNLLTHLIRVERKPSTFATPRQIAEERRAALCDALKDTPLRVLTTNPTMGVAWIQLSEGWNCKDYCKWLESKSIIVLPGNPFFWYDATKGNSFVRVALMRPAEIFSKALESLRTATLEYVTSQNLCQVILGQKLNG